MNDTICAISTSIGIGAISIVRVTGSDAINIVNRVIKHNDLNNVESHSILYDHIIDDDSLIDEVLIMVMKSPKTYTTEDVIEINCHGGISTTNKILELLLKNGARLAEPGEFTKRAYLNGRINLIEAESINDLIVAKTEAARTLAINNVDGMITKKIKNIREKMAKILANIEVNIDYPEYTDEVQVTNDLIEDELMIMNESLKKLVDDSKNGRLIKEGVNVAIIGKPNVGKSSILNHLLDEEKAIVTEIPGTTRDVVEGSITINNVAINFLDTAGIRETEDVVEKIGVDKSKKIASNADIILLVLNNNKELDKIDEEMLNEYNKNKIIIFVNKNDLDTNINLEKYQEYDIVYGNTIDLNGLDELKNAISKKLNLEHIVTKDMSYLSNVRQIDLINKASDALKSAYKSYKESMPIDMIEIDIKEAWELLGKLIGDFYEEELVDTIFSNFCLGK